MTAAVRSVARIFSGGSKAAACRPWVSSSLRSRCVSMAQRHGVQVRVKLRQADAVALHQRGVFDSSFVIGKAFLGRQARHPDVHAGLLTITIRVGDLQFF